MKLLTSNSISNFRDKAEKTWKLERYEWPRDKFEDTVFFGMYHIFDWRNLLRHKGKRFVLWAGGDILYLKRGWAFSEGEGYLLSRLFSWIPWNKFISKIKAEHYVENILENKELKELGIKSFVVPSFLEDIKDFDISFIPSENPHLFTCMRKDRESEYGLNTILRIAPEVPFATFHIYGINKTLDLDYENVVFHGEVDPKQFNQEIKGYHSGLRTNEHDGFSEVVAKSILLGQYPITKIKYNNVWHYDTDEELVGLINQLAKRKEPNILAREYWLKQINHFSWKK